MDPLTLTASSFTLTQGGSAVQAALTLGSGNTGTLTPTKLTTAVGDMGLAYTDAASRPTPDFLNLDSGNIGTSAHFEGIILCQTQVTLRTSSTMNGRILAQTMAALQQATVTVPAP